MQKSRQTINVMGLSLGVLYAVTVLVYLELLKIEAFSKHAAAIILFMVGLFISSLGVISLKEWARRSMVLLNAVLCFYLLFLVVYYPRQVEPIFIFITLSAVIFFNQTNVRLKFQPGLKFSRKSILVIDDDEGFIKTVKRMLLPKGYSVLSATTGEKGLQVAKLQKPDLIILDVILPGIKGREVCIKLKEDSGTQHIPVIFVTAKDSPDDVAAEMAAGGDSHLTKPFNGKILLNAIKSCIGTMD